MRFPLALVALTLLAACATAQQRCISRSTNDLRTVTSLEATAAANLSRGYGYETRTDIRFERQRCGKTELGEAIYCRVPVEYSRQVPVAIDLEAEARKLAQLSAKRAALAKAAEPAIRACQMQYPDQS
jgi:glutathionyl-hydroquinone reductase